MDPPTAVLSCRLPPCGGRLRPPLATPGEDFLYASFKPGSDGPGRVTATLSGLRWLPLRSRAGRLARDMVARLWVYSRFTRRDVVTPSPSPPMIKGRAVRVKPTARPDSPVRKRRQLHLPLSPYSKFAVAIGESGCHSYSITLDDYVITIDKRNKGSVVLYLAFPINPHA